MNGVTAIRIVGVVLGGIALVHFLGMPWGLVLTASAACLFIP